VASFRSKERFLVTLEEVEEVISDLLFRVGGKLWDGRDLFWLRHLIFILLNFNVLFFDHHYDGVDQ